MVVRVALKMELIDTTTEGDGFPEAKLDLFKRSGVPSTRG